MYELAAPTGFENASALRGICAAGKRNNQMEELVSEQAPRWETKAPCQHIYLVLVSIVALS